MYHDIVSSFVGWFVCFLGQWWFSVWGLGCFLAFLGLSVLGFI